jgi:phospholipid transport system substrate-binding protein
VSPSPRPRLPGARHHLIAGLLVATSLLLSQTARAQGSPKSTLETTNAQINSLLRKTVAAGSAAEKKQKDEIKRIINNFLDYTELGKRGLGDNWEKRSSTEQKQFVDLLRDLIERNYVKQLRGNLDYQVAYTNEELTGDEALVTSMVKSAGKDGRNFETRIDYKLKKKSGKWLVFDVITDEVSLVQNYRAQFNKIIAKESYEALVKKMKSKLAEEG